MTHRKSPIASPIFRFDCNDAILEEKKRIAADKIDVEYKEKFVTVKNRNGAPIVESRNAIKPIDTPATRVRLVSSGVDMRGQLSDCFLLGLLEVEEAFDAVPVEVLTELKAEDALGSGGGKRSIDFAIAR